MAQSLLHLERTDWGVFSLDISQFLECVQSHDFICSTFLVQLCFFSDIFCTVACQLSLFILHFSSSPSTPKTMWTWRHFPLLSCRTCQNIFMASLSFSHTHCLARRYPSTASGFLQASHALLDTFFSLTAPFTTGVQQAVLGLAVMAPRNRDHSDSMSP